MCCDFHVVSSCLLFFFFKQKTAYEMRISDWSSDVCSSDLADRRQHFAGLDADGAQIDRHGVFAILRAAADAQKARAEPTRFGVAVVSDDPAFEQDAGEQQ